MVYFSTNMDINAVASRLFNRSLSYLSGSLIFRRPSNVSKMSFNCFWQFSVNSVNSCRRTNRSSAVCVSKVSAMFVRNPDYLTENVSVHIPAVLFARSSRVTGAGIWRHGRPWWFLFFILFYFILRNLHIQNIILFSPNDHTQITMNRNWNASTYAHCYNKTIFLFMTIYLNIGYNILLTKRP